MELRTGGHTDALGSAKERLMLAALAHDAGRPVSLDTLLHRLWDDAPPAKPRASLHAYAARIRRRLRTAGCDERLVQQAHTYTLDVRPGLVDCHHFKDLAARALALTDGGDDTEALGLLREAEELWRGEPLTGLPGLWAERVRTSLTEQRLGAQLTRIGIELRRGHFAEVAVEVAALLEQRPSDETLAGMLMTAAYGCGRQADALRVYDTVRRHLREDLGTDPGEPLTRLHGLILDGAPVRQLLPAPEPAVTAPHTLPSHADMVGRQAELDAIIRASTAPHSPHVPRTVIALQTISGMAGVGKSLLAVHAASRLGRHFPDGQIHLDLRAHSVGQEPLTARAALTALLRVLGVPASTLPEGLDELVALWRTLLSTRRAIVVLDDVAGPDQLRPLLPGPSPSLVIVTSRRRITGLPGVRSVLLDVLPPRDAVALFRRLAGEERTTRANEVADIVRLSGHLPLAIELAAGRLASRPTWTTAHLLHRLTHGHGRLKEFRDGYQEVARAFEISYQTLTVEEQTVFRLLGLQLGPNIDAFATAALTDLPLDSVERVLESLLDAYLIQEPSPERYAFHDLLGEYSRTLATSEDPPAARERALHRLIVFYIQASDAADRMIHPRRLRGGPPRPTPSGPVPRWPSPAAARQWLISERAALIAAERHCRTHGRPREAALLAGTLAAFLVEEGYTAESRRMHESAARYWGAAGQHRAQVRALLDLGTALSHCGRYDPALTATERALQIATDSGDAEAKAEVLHLLGVLHWNLGSLSTALSHQSETLSLRLDSGDLWQTARSQNNLGITHLYLGNSVSADEHFNAALAGFRATHDAREEAHVLNNLSDLHAQNGDPESARRFLHEALDILEDSGSQGDRAITQVNLANTMNSPDELNAMLDLYRDSLTAFRRLGDRRNASNTLHGMGSALHAAGRFREAAAQHRRALDLARSIGAAHEESQALHGLGLAEHGLGHASAAAGHINAAIETADRIGAAREAARARESLAAVAGTAANRSS
ncbi:BTAD domain-containing putative transcriptional regulator [Streptomyces sp. NPDC058644]|uniref:AfsR/SARP family transcriptional regulator n=1 Tax=unclassified Streptomyces TaxID=2593676 RepID=UPI00366173A6